MSLTLTYQLDVRRGDALKIELPVLRSSSLLLRDFELISDQKAFDFKLTGKDTIVSYGEAVFYQTNHFDLSDKISQIIDADHLQFSIRNLCTGKESSIVKATVIFHYLKKEDDIIIFNNIYNNVTPEGLATILTDISKAGKYVTKIVMTSPNKLSFIDLQPQFSSEPIWLKPIKEVVDSRNQIVMDLTDMDKYDPDLISQLNFYKLTIPENVEKLGIIVYGYHH